jgi:hypothetical protein
MLAAAASINGNPSATTTAVIALVGAIIGGALTAGAQLLIEARRAARAGKDQRRQAKVAARMFAVDLARAHANIEYVVEYGEWWKFGLGPRMSDEDRRLVLGELPPEGFYIVDRAEAAIDHWNGIREREIVNGYEIPADRIDMDKLREILGWLKAAQVPLSKITGDPPRVEIDDSPVRLGP